jgi:hypothetical protein
MYIKQAVGETSFCRGVLETKLYLSAYVDDKGAQIYDVFHIILLNHSSILQKHVDNTCSITP